MQKRQRQKNGMNTDEQSAEYKELNKQKSKTRYHKL